jgi:molybdopterin-guanine dinucleotide biosynthesis protein A
MPVRQDRNRDVLLSGREGARQVREQFPASGYVLVGGESRRLGSEKPLLELEGQPLFMRAVKLLEGLADTVTLLGPPERYASFGLPVLSDRKVGGGPLVAVLTGLESSPYDWSVFLACDLPRLERRFVTLLLERAQNSNGDAVVARTSDGWQPLCAAYRKTCLPIIEGAIEEGHFAVVDVLPALRVDVITSPQLAALGLSEAIFENINSQADWARVLERQGDNP